MWKKSAAASLAALLLSASIAHSDIDRLCGHDAMYVPDGELKGTYILVDVYPKAFALSQCKYKAFATVYYFHVLDRVEVVDGIAHLYSVEDWHIAQRKASTLPVDQMQKGDLVVSKAYRINGTAHVKGLVHKKDFKDDSTGYYWVEKSAKRALDIIGGNAE